MACDDPTRAKKELEEIWSGFCRTMSLSEAESRSAYIDLTVKYALPWWVDEPDLRRNHALERLASDVCNNKKAQKTRYGSKKKNRRRRGR